MSEESSSRRPDGSWPSRGAAGGTRRSPREVVGRRRHDVVGLRAARPEVSRPGMVSRTIRVTRVSRDMTGRGQHRREPSPRPRPRPCTDARRWARCGPVPGRARRAAPPEPVTEPHQRPRLRQVERAGGDPLVLLLHPVEVGPGLGDLGLQGADGGGHGVERLDLEGVDGVHRLVDVVEGALQLGQPDRRRGGLLLDLHRSCPSISEVRSISPEVVSLRAVIWSRTSFWLPRAWATMTAVPAAPRSSSSRRGRRPDQLGLFLMTMSMARCSGSTRQAG